MALMTLVIETQSSVKEKSSVILVPQIGEKSITIWGCFTFYVDKGEEGRVFQMFMQVHKPQ